MVLLQGFSLHSRGLEGTLTVLGIGTGCPGGIRDSVSQGVSV